jgi:hypothetical protein
LTFDKKRQCKVCLACHPPQSATPPPPKEKKKYLDVKMTEGQVIEIIKDVVPDMIREELENWHIQRPPVTKKEIKTWRQEAKEMGVPLNKKTGGMRKKVDVLAEIELKKGADNGKEKIEKEASQDLD